uniref:ACT domain-containing protein ACR n=1 Tax=Oryza brachyantha TaxID=4533 RepID=J3MUR4_ORYBR
MMACGSPRTEVVDEFEKLVIRMNPPRVTVDNTSDMTATLVKVDSANKYGTLLEVVQVLTDLKLTIKRAYISSDGEWFMDVFHVVDQEGNKLYDCQVIDRIELSLGAGSLSFRAPERSVGVEAEAEAAQTAIELIGKDRPGLLSEVFAVLTDLKCNIVASEYVVFHGTVIAEGSEAYQEYYIRHLDDSPVTSGVEREHLRRCLEAAIQRRNTDGVRLELCCEDRVGLLSDVTRIFREHGLSVTHAEVATRAARAANVFYVVDASGEAVQAQAVEAVRAEIGEQVLFVREDAAGAGAAGGPRSPPGRDRRSLGNMIRSRSEKFLYNLGLIRSCS